MQNSLGRWTLPASCYCPGGHNALADSVRGCGHYLLAVSVQADTIR